MRRLTANKIKTRAELIRRMNDTEVMTELIAAATKAAVLEHKRIGNPIATWRDGKVLIVQPEDIDADGNVRVANE